MIVYETLSQAVGRYRAILLTVVPLDWRSVTFAFLMGSIFSYPIGALLATVRPFEPPEWTADVFWISFFGSLLLLPFWSYFALRTQPLLRRLGLRFSVFFFVAIIVAGYLFPS